ncbi:MAG: hypothetical protein ACXIT4_01810 [Erythrobacter sp.]
MTRLLNWLWNRLLLFALLVAAFAFAALAWPGLPQVMRHFEAESLGAGEISALVESDFARQQAQLAERAAEARTLGPQSIAARIAEAEAALADAEKRREEASAGVFAAYRPSRIVARTRAEIDMAAISAELGVLRAALAPRQQYERARRFLDAKPTMPTTGAIAAAQSRCEAATQALQTFDDRGRMDQAVREVFLLERQRLAAAQGENCERASDLAERRKAALAARQNLREAEAALAALAADPLPQGLIENPGRATLRDILVKALWALAAITLAPFIYRTIAYYALAPMAARWPPMRFAPDGARPPQPVATPSAISVAITLGEHDEALVRQDYLQSSSLMGAKRTRWLLDWRHPFSSLASGMRFLTAIRGDGERVSVSAVKDPFAELAILKVPEGAACVVRPSALAALVRDRRKDVRVTSHWRLFSLPAWLTGQLRYLAFHGPARLVVKGGRGVRIEAAERGRIVGEGQIVGFSTDLAYSVIRSETFWPYFFGREALLKDRIAAGRGVLLIEEAPLAGRSGLRRGFEGMIDALLKVGGV